MSDDPEPLAEAPPIEVQEAQEERLARVWATPTGWRYWSAVNNEKVGLWYTSLSLLFFIFGGALALVMRAQLAVPNNQLLSAARYDELFTMHGSVMMFLFAVPIFEAFSIMVLPEMLGARDLPFPRLSAYGFWCFAIGGIFVCGSLFFGGAPRGGWFMYPPLVTEYIEGHGVDVWLLGLSFIEVASIAAAVELLVGVLMCRPPGMRINLIPLYAWYLMVVAVMIIFAFPPLIAGDLLLELERAMNWPFFDVERGGNPLLWQHLFWIFGHPEVYIVFLPSIALLAMMVPTFSRTKMVGYRWVVLAALGTGFLSFGLWVHHMFTTGLPGMSLGIFSAASEAIAIPTGIQLFCFIATLWVGRARWTVPMLYVVGGLSTFVIGGLSGVMLALVPFDLQAHDTYFVVGHLHSVLIGGTIFPIFAAIHYFFPLVREHKLSERWGKISFWLIFVGFNTTFMPMHITGLLGMPRRVYTYIDDPALAALNLVSSIGAGVLAMGVLIFVADILRPRSHLPPCERNPWDAGTLEWLADIPDKPWGVRSIPEIDSRYPLWDQPNFVRDVDEGRFYLPDAEEGRRETIITSPVDAKPTQVLRVPGPTFLTLWAAIFTGGVFILSTYHLWIPAGISGVLALGVILRWLWTGTGEIPEKEDKNVGLGLTLPIYTSGRRSTGWWAMLITMLADAVAFVSLIFGYFFFWTSNDAWPPAHVAPLQPEWPLVCAMVTIVGWAGLILARRFNRADRAGAFYLSLVSSVTCFVGGAVAAVAGPVLSGIDPTLHTYGAMVCALVVWCVAHLALGVLMTLYCLARRLFRRMDATHDAELVNVGLYGHFLLMTIIVTVAVVVGFPLAV